MRFLVTGANGFVGQPLCNELLRQGHSVRAAVRSGVQIGDVAIVAVGAIDGGTDWAEALRDIDVVIHLAARVHVMQDTAADPLQAFLEVNVQGSANLACQAAAAGVKRLVYVSSIKVSGDATDAQPFVESDKPDPQDAYAVSKLRAEQELRRIAQESGLEIVILRPPLVYGAGVKGNFIGLLDAIDKGIPLPLASVHNKRSLIYLGNLMDVLIVCATHPAAAGKTYLVHDGEDISIVDLVRQVAASLGMPAGVFPVHTMLLRGLGKLLGRRQAVQRVVGSLRINDDLIRKELNWKPRFTLQDGLQATADWYKTQHCLPVAAPEKKPSRAANADGDVSVVIVNYNAGAILLECIASAQQQNGKVVVVDNASVDNSIVALKSAYPAIKLICNERNRGFSVACNQGVKLTDSDYIFFLNPDCVLNSNALQILIGALCSAGDVGMVGGLLTNPDGTEQGGGRRAVPTPWRSFVRAFGLGALGNRYPGLFSDFSLHKQPLPEHPVDVEAISGACMLVRRDALEEVGLLDEGYFMHCEDLDWCMRFRQKGWRILFVPDARMIHHKGHCSQSRPIFVEWHKHRGMMRFYRKFFRRQYPGLLMGLVAVGVWMRFGAIAVYHLTLRLLDRLELRRG